MTRNDALVTSVKNELREKLRGITNPDAQLIGFANKSGEIFPFGTDSKIVGRLFEVLSKAAIQSVADRLNLTLYESEQQNSYPDFWLADSKNPDTDRIAIDIKSTYRKFNKKNEVSKFNFTLGSYASFLRNGTKNINGNYAMYSGHLIMGFLYTRALNPTETTTNFTDIDGFIPPFYDVEAFVSEKHAIASDKPGSGNTENIATIKSNNIANFENEIGPFASMGEEAFVEYWVNHPRYREENKNYSDLAGYLNWKQSQDPEAANVLIKAYQDWLTK